MGSYSRTLAAHTDALCCGCGPRTGGRDNATDGKLPRAEKASLSVRSPLAISDGAGGNAEGRVHLVTLGARLKVCGDGWRLGA